MSFAGFIPPRTIQDTPLTVLIVDDNPDDAAHYMHLLRRAGLNATCHHAELGEQGAQLLQLLKPDCVLLDFHLPDMDAQDFLAQCRPDMPVLVITGSAEHTVAAGVLQLGASQLLHKRTLDAESLRTHLADSLRDHSLKRQLRAQRERMQAVLDSTTQGMLFLQRDAGAGWLVAFQNPAAHTMLSLSTGPLGDEVPELLALLNRAAQQGHASCLEMRWQGRRLRLDCVPGADGCTVTVRDVEEDHRRADIERARHEVLQRFVEARPLPEILRAVRDLLQATLPGRRGEVLAGPLLLTWPYLSALGVTAERYPLVGARSARSAFVPDIGRWAIPVISPDAEHLLGALLVSADATEACPACLDDVVSLTALLLMQAQDREHLERQAWRDALTELPNRPAFLAALSRALEPDALAVHPCAVGVLDLDGFKKVNDTHGHAGGDALLTQVARRLRNAFPAPDVVARVGGDEFTLLLTTWTDPLALERDVRRRLRLALVEPFQVQGEFVTVRAPAHAASLDRLLHLADRAMYRVKHRGGELELALSELE